MFLCLALLPNSEPWFLPSPGSAVSLGRRHLQLFSRWVVAAGPGLTSAFQSVPKGEEVFLRRPQPAGSLCSVAPLGSQARCLAVLLRAGLSAIPARWPQAYPGEGAQPQKGGGGEGPGQLSAPASVSVACGVPIARFRSSAASQASPSSRGDPLRALALAHSCSLVSEWLLPFQSASVLFWTFLSVFMSEICSCYQNLFNKGS